MYAFYIRIPLKLQVEALVENELAKNGLESTARADVQSPCSALHTILCIQMHMLSMCLCCVANKPGCISRARVRVCSRVHTRAVCALNRRRTHMCAQHILVINSMLYSFGCVRVCTCVCVAGVGRYRVRSA